MSRATRHLQFARRHALARVQQHCGSISSFPSFSIGSFLPSLRVQWLGTRANACQKASDRCGRAVREGGAQGKQVNTATVPL